jgi:serine/threonine protein kinase
MGAAASIEQNNPAPANINSDDKQAAAILASKSANAASLDLQTAYSALQAKVKTATSEYIGPTSIHMLALRQLSQKLKNQESLERNKRKVLKSRSVPFNIQEGSSPENNSMERSQTSIGGHRDDHDDLEHEDLEVVHDSDYALTPPKPDSSKSLPKAEEKQARVNEDTKQVPNISDAKASSDSSNSTASVTASAIKKKKPILSLQVSEHFDTDAKHTGDSPKPDYKDSPEIHPAPKVPNNANIVTHADSRISPNGTLYMGKVKVLETGIVSSEKRTKGQHHLSNSQQQHQQQQQHYENIKRNFRQDRGYILSPNAESGNASWVLHRNESGRVIDPDDGEDRTFEMAFSASMRQASSFYSHSQDEDLNNSLSSSNYYQTQNALPSMSKKDFIEIATLGSGASGVVSEAIHVPTLTIVALKMLPVYNQEKRMHVARELGVLYRNLVEMRLIDDLFGEENDVETSREPRAAQSASDSNRNGHINRCPNVLSLYNAFKDPASGMINLVVEYMDGGSLEDLVRQGGCQDEHILSDIAFQTLTGLAYLHKNKNVHRDIKPANILCSSSGLIKIADFGISKALDKTTGFANSFVGTVSYMSPERITAENYSFPCDIWSLGLTILAVAKGRFPISTRTSTKSKVSPAAGLDSKLGDDDDKGGNGVNEESDNDSDGEPMVIAGPGGYWAMIKAICDDEPPKAGKRFSSQFNRFIAHCLQKDANDRLSAKQLLEESPFVLSYHQQQLQRQQSRRLLLPQQCSQSNVLISNPSLQAESSEKEYSSPLLYHSVAEEKLTMSSEEDAGRKRKDSEAKSTHSNATNSNKSHASYQLPDDSGPTSSSRESSARTQRPSALKARLTSVTLAKNNVDVSTPSNSNNASHHNFNSNTNSNNFNSNSNKEDISSVHSAPSSSYLPSSPTRLPLVTTASTASSTTNSTPQTDSYPNRHYPHNENGGQDSRSFDFNINWADPSIWENLGGLGNLDNLEQLGASLGAEMLEKDMDDLGLGPEELSAIYAIRFEHLGTLLQKIAQKLQLTSPGSSSSEVQVAEESASLDEDIKHQRENLLHIQEDESMHQLQAEEEEELFQLAAPPPRHPKSSANQNTLRNKSTNRAVLALTEDDGDNDDKRPPISPRLGDNLGEPTLDRIHNSHHQPHYNTTNATNMGASGNASVAPMVKQKSILKSQNNNNSHHNVQFTVTEETQISSASAATASKINSNSNNKAGGLRQRLQLKTLSLQVDGDDTTSTSATGGDVSETAAEAKVEGITSLPRPSSYFIRSSQSKDEDDAPSHANGSSNQHQYLSNSASEKARAAEAYRQMLPKVDVAHGLAKWRHLATQLHLPVPVVVLAARAYLGSLVRNEATFPKPGNDSNV